MSKVKILEVTTPAETPTAPGHETAQQRISALVAASEARQETEPGMADLIRGKVADLFSSLTSTSSKVADIVEAGVCYIARFKPSKKAMLALLADANARHDVPAPAVFVRQPDGTTHAKMNSKGEYPPPRKNYRAWGGTLYRLMALELEQYDIKKDTPDGITFVQTAGVMVNDHVYHSVIDALRGHDGRPNPRDLVLREWNNLLRPKVEDLGLLDPIRFKAARDPKTIAKHRVVYRNDENPSAGSHKVAEKAIDSAAAVRGTILGLIDAAASGGLHITNEQADEIVLALSAITNDLYGSKHSAE